MTFNVIDTNATYFLTRFSFLGVFLTLFLYMKIVICYVFIEASRGYFYHLSKESKMANENPEKLQDQQIEKKRRARRQRVNMLL